MTRAKSRTTGANSRTWNIHLTAESRKLGIPSAWIKMLLKDVLVQVESDIAIPEVCEIHLVLTDDARMRVLNREHRKKDKPTDVLSFPQFNPKEISGKSRKKVEAPGPSSLPRQLSNRRRSSGLPSGLNSCDWSFMESCTCAGMTMRRSQLLRRSA